ncbi:MAG: hypothetical protein JWO79_4623 [Actinomycetia bacterium]|jgi:uncharacterized protein YcnI|nr:hypothetical protein [Actinomycetes bacterium]MDQ1653030.1 hypothetical protein [Cryptosporangiaceae bacterium]MDQ1657997.1 hypothetical protein [Cryptosporangiaceae bacterium]
MPANTSTSTVPEGAPAVTRFARRTALVALGAAAVTALWTGVASAHVTVNPSTAVQGGFTKLTFRVPNETEKTNTTKVEVALPMDSPLGSVSVKPVPGWTTTVTNAKLDKPIKTDDGEVTEAPSRITWTAEGDAAIKPGEFQEFDLSVGPMPEKDSMVFKALQTYSDGSVVRWIDIPNGKDEPEHPAPTVALTKKAATATTAANGTATASDKDSNGPATGLAIAALVIALAGLALGVVAFVRTRKTTTPA